MRVLVIDDMEGVRKFVKRALERAGHVVLLIEDGKDAAVHSIKRQATTAVND